MKHSIMTLMEDHSELIRRDILFKVAFPLGNFHSPVIAISSERYCLDDVRTQAHCIDMIRRVTRELADKVLKAGVKPSMESVMQWVLDDPSEPIGRFVMFFYDTIYEQKTKKTKNPEPTRCFFCRVFAALFKRRK